MEIIAKIYTDFPSKFGIPRQSGIAVGRGEIVFEQKYRVPEALRGIDGYSYLWLIWEFSDMKKGDWSPTVRPPRLGGNRRMGVFATRSTNRPNSMGLSSVRLLEVLHTRDRGDVLVVEGADIKSGTPIYDIKPYLPYTDSHPDAKAGFAGEHENYVLSVDFPEELYDKVPKDKAKCLVAILENDPRPSYQDDPLRVYGFGFAGMEIKFKVSGEKLTVINIE